MKRSPTMARIILSRRMTCWYLSPIIAFGTVAFILFFSSLLLTTDQELHIAAGAAAQPSSSPCWHPPSPPWPFVSPWQQP